MLAFVLANATRITHFSFVPLVNQQQIIFRAAERPWAGWLVRRLSAPLSALFCLRAPDRLHQTERSQSRELPSVSLTHITPGLYHITGQSKRTQRTAANAVSVTRALVSSTALHDLKEAPGPQMEEGGWEDKGERDIPTSAGCQLNAGMLIYGRF